MEIKLHQHIIGKARVELTFAKKKNFRAWLEKRFPDVYEEKVPIYIKGIHV